MNAYKDENSIPTLIAVDETDGSTIVRIKADSVTHGLFVSNGTAGSDFGNNDNSANRDENNIPTLIAVSSVTATVNGVNYIEGVTPVNVYATSDGKLLIDTN